MPTTTNTISDARPIAQSMSTDCSASGSEPRGPACHNLSLEEATERVDRLRLESIQSYLRRLHDWPVSLLNSTKREYKRYLILVLCNQEKMIVPGSGEYIDEFWRAHILHTQKYADDARLLRCFIHHNPSPHPQTEPGDPVTFELATSKTVEDELVATLDLYKETFGAPAPVEFW